MTADRITPERPQVVVPELCKKHQRDLIVRRLKVPESGPWQGTLAAAQLLLFNRAAADPRIVARAEQSTENLTLVLAEVGCLACYLPEWYRRSITVLRRGLGHAIAVAYGKDEDPEWPKEAPDA